MADEWKQVPLGDLIEFTRDGEWGSDQPRPDRREMLVVRGTDFARLRLGALTEIPRRYIDRIAAERKQLHAGDVLIETAGGTKDQSTGRTALVNQNHIERAGLPITCASFARFLRFDRQKVDPRFMYWWLQSLYASGEMETHQVQHTGVARFQFTKFVENTKAPLPSLSEQRAIAHILGTLDDKIELNRRMNETLEAMARVLFKSWFVDFDPVRARAEGRDLCLPKSLADLFPTRLVDSEQGEIPEGWRVGCVADEFELTMGQSPPGESYNEIGEGLPFFQGRADFGHRFPTRRVYCTAPTRMARAEDTLISVRAPVGDINMASEDCAIGRGVAAARHKTGSRGYTYQFMRSLEKVFSRFEAEGTVFGSIGKSDFHAIPCIVPRREVVVGFETMLSPIDSRLEFNQHEAHTLVALRDTLLPKLISGELRLNEAY